MNSLPAIWQRRTSIWRQWIAIAVAIVIAAAGTASLPRNASADPLDPPSLDSDYTYRVRAINANTTDREDQPGISVPQCNDSGVAMF
ncbi:MAG: hypothetical protein OXE50_12495, partial [Chloroflexi bacterium]|nr:hypothetical protein [Chloroflexota bacterium]